jgi:hypothetical protein
MQLLEAGDGKRKMGAEIRETGKERRQTGVETGKERRQTGVETGMGKWERGDGRSKTEEGRRELAHGRLRTRDGRREMKNEGGRWKLGKTGEEPRETADGRWQQRD